MREGVRDLNLHGIVSGAISAVNPPIQCAILRSSGYTMGAGARQVPTYDLIADVTVQAQDLSSGDLRRIDGLNLQGEKKSIYLNGQWTGVVRVDKVGGDLFIFGGRTWLGTAILEQWPDWTKVVVTLQNDMPPPLPPFVRATVTVP